MRILVYPHDMNMGGSQINAIEIAAEVKKMGHDVLIFGQPGALTEMVTDLGLEFIESPRVRTRPTPSIVQALRSLINDREIDILHGYEWPPALEATLAVGTRETIRAVSTVLSMSVAPFIPKHVPLMVGTEEIAALEVERGRGIVGLMEPPVDTFANAPDTEVGTANFALQWGIDLSIPIVSVVSRLAHEMKLEGILTAISVVERCNQNRPLQLLIAGNGPASQEVRSAADTANQRLGFERIILTGQLDDPRPAYAIADVALGMGGSALKAMAFQKPLIVQGEQGFWGMLTKESLDTFLWQGWYGVGAGSESGFDRLQEQLETLLSNPSLRLELGKFSRSIVVERFSIRAAAQRQIKFYQDALANQASLPEYVRSLSASSLGFARYKLERVLAKVQGRLQRDDFNAAPVAGIKAENKLGVTS